jgi:hypothetical protein
VTAGTAVLYGADYQLNGTAPFTFTGFLSAFDPATGATLFERSFRGSGVAKVYLYPSDRSRFVYQYEVTPVPEPTTLVLLGTGMLGVFARRRARPRFSSGRLRSRDDLLGGKLVSAQSAR